MEQIKLFFTLSFFSIITAGYYNNYSNPPIIVATVCGDLSQVKSYCTASTINAKGNNGQTALMHSCISDSGDIFVFLMENNADFNIKDSFGKTALDYAIEHNRVEMIEYLAISGADNNLSLDEALKIALKIQNIKKQTQELITEIRKTNPDLDKIRLFISAGADVNAIDNNGRTALIWAAFSGCTEMAKLLISAGADVNIKDNNGETALIWAASSGCKKMVRLLIDAGADVNIKNNYNGSTVLMMAARDGYTETLQLLINAAGADVNIKNDKGKTALMYAAKKGYTEIAKLLIAAGTDVNAKNNNNNTALMLAKDYNYPRIVKLLEQHAKNKAKANSTKKAKIISAKKALNRKNNRGTN